jgi:hypothetical protein
MDAVIVHALQAPPNELVAVAESLTRLQEPVCMDLLTELGQVTLDRIHRQAMPTSACLRIARALAQVCECACVCLRVYVHVCLCGCVNVFLDVRLFVVDKSQNTYYL